MNSKLKSGTVVLSLFIGLLASMSSEKGKQFAKHLNEKFSNQNNTIELLPVKLGSHTGKEGLQFKSKTYLPLVKDSIRLTDFEFSKQFAQDEGEQSKLGIEINSEDLISKDLEKWSKKYKNHKLAVIVNGDVVTVPNFRNAVMGEGFELIVNDPNSFERVFDGLIN